MKKPTIKQLLLLAAAIVSASAISQNQTATPTIKDFNIDADKWEKNFKTGETLFTGNVKMRHGAFLIEAESLVAYQNSDDVLERAVAQGNPAVFQQLPSAADGREKVNASGNKIEFTDTAVNQSVKITSNALLQQGGITAICNEITFILEDGVVQQMVGSRGSSQCQASSNNSQANTDNTTTPATN